MGSTYYNSSYQSAVADNTYSVNGYAPSLPLNTLTPISWNGWNGYGSNVYYVRIEARSDGNYGVSPITLSDFKFITEGKSNYGKIIYATTSDSSGIKTTKWLAGAKTVNDFASAGNTLNSSFEVTSNGTYTIYTEDKAGNKAIKQVVINDIDTSYPTVSFGTNGNATYATTRSTKVTVSDNVGINTNGLKYVWTTSTTAPSPSAFTVTFTSGATISTPPGLTGGYYLWISAQDTAGNTTITRSNVFNLDNSNPTVTAATTPTTWTTGNKTITVTGSDTGSSGIAGYYISTSSTKPTTGSAWTASTSTTWTVSRGAGTYYIWIKDGVENISSTYKSVTVTNIDGSAPTVTAKGSSYTITEGASNVISSTYFNITANGTAPITSTTCVDTSKSNAAVTNTSTLAAGSHVIRCTVTKQNGLSSNAQTTIVVNPAYTCSTGILTNDASKGWICVRSANSSTSWSVRCPNGSTCGTTGSACCRTSKLCTSWTYYETG